MFWFKRASKQFKTWVRSSSCSAHSSLFFSLVHRCDELARSSPNPAPFYLFRPHFAQSKASDCLEQFKDGCDALERTDQYRGLMANGEHGVHIVWHCIIPDYQTELLLSDCDASRCRAIVLTFIHALRFAHFRGWKTGGCTDAGSLLGVRRPRARFKMEEDAEEASRAGGGSRLRLNSVRASV